MTTVQPSFDPSTWLLIGAVAVIEIGLLISALVDILKRTDDEVTGGRRWVWILLALFVNFIGPILYFAIGRKPKTVADVPGSADEGAQDRTSRAVDALYGPDDPKDR